jgi:hypothetical protein
LSAVCLCVCICGMSDARVCACVCMCVCMCVRISWAYIYVQGGLRHEDALVGRGRVLLQACMNTHTHTHAHIHTHAYTHTRTHTHTHTHTQGQRVVSIAAYHVGGRRATGASPNVCSSRAPRRHRTQGVHTGVCMRASLDAPVYTLCYLLPPRAPPVRRGAQSRAHRTLLLVKPTTCLGALLLPLLFKRQKERHVAY